MQIIKIIFIVLIVLNIMLRIWSIDKKREPVTRQETMVGLVLDAVLIYLLLN